MAASDSLLTTVWTCTVSQGTDPTPAARLSGAPQIFNTTTTTQKIIGGVVGVRYILQAVVTTAQGYTLSLFSHNTVEVIS